DEIDGTGRYLRRRVRRAGEEQGLIGNRAQGVAREQGNVTEQLLRLLDDDLWNVARRRHLLALLVDLALRLDRDSLVRRQCVNRKKSGRMSCQTVQCYE